MIPPGLLPAARPGRPRVPHRTAAVPRVHDSPGSPLAPAFAASGPDPATGAAVSLGRGGPGGPAVGFKARRGDAGEGEAIRSGGDQHLLTVAPTGAGKGVSCVIPALLEYPGSVVAFDPKGELWRVTARRRRELDQRVVILNPFGTLARKSDKPGRLNPLDLLTLPGADLETDAQMLAALLSADFHGGKDPFWNAAGRGVVGGLIAHAAGMRGAHRTLYAVHAALHNDDVPYSLAQLLDARGDTMNPFARRELAAFLQHADSQTRPGVQATAANYLKCVAGGSVPHSLGGQTGTSSFDLGEFAAGAPTTVYLVIPPTKLDSHRGLLRLWVGTLLTAVMTRDAPPPDPTLFLLDEAAQLGPFPPLEQAVTLCRGYGLRVWSFWQDLAQLKTCYPTTWPSILNNSGVKQAFGIDGAFAARGWGEVLDTPARTLRDLEADEQILALPGGLERRARRLNYLRDPEYAGLFDPSPRHTHAAAPAKPPRVRRSTGPDRPR